MLIVIMIHKKVYQLMNNENDYKAVRPWIYGLLMMIIMMINEWWAVMDCIDICDSHMCDV